MARRSRCGTKPASCPSGTYLAASRLTSPPKADPKKACVLVHPSTTGFAGRSASGSLSIASDDSRVPSAVTTTLSPSLCLQARSANPRTTKHKSLFISEDLTRRKRAENLEQRGLPLDFLERGHDASIRDVSRHFDVKKVVPVFTAPRPRMDGLQIDASLGEVLEHIEQRPGGIVNPENEGGRV